MKNKITNNWELKLLAILFSVVIWLVVVNIDDPVKSVQFSGIDVEILNGDALTERGQVYEVLDGTDKVAVTVKGRRSIIEDIAKENIRATADMQDISNMDTISIRLSTNKYADVIDDIKCDTQNVKLSIEGLKRVQKVIEVVTEGVPLDNYILGDLTTNLNQVYLEGPESSIQKVTSVKATLDVDGVSSSISSSIPLILYDKDGNQVDDTRIIKNINTVSVTQTILATKEVPVIYEVSGVPAEGYALTGSIKSEVSSVVVAGSKLVVDATKEIVVKGSQLDVTDLQNDLVARIDLEDALPSSLTFADSAFNKVTSVVVEINRETFLSEEIEKEDFLIINAPSGMKAEYSVNQTYINNGVITLKMTGLSQNLEEVDVNNLVGFIDLQRYMTEQGMEELTEGTYNIVPDFRLPEGVTLQTEIRITVHVAKK